MPSKPELILDTNICGKLVSVSKSYSKPIIACLNRDFRIVVSPQTYFELLNGIINGDESYFEVDKEKIRIMLGNGKPKFLPFPGTFALKKMLVLTVTISPLNPAAFKKHVQVILHAPNHKALFDDGVRLPAATRRKLLGLDPDIHKRQHQAGINEHKKLMERVRLQTGIFPRPDVWVKNIAKSLKHDLNQQQTEHLAKALDAAYQYDKALCETVASTDYNLEKHEGDWIDGEQLFYLCDPNVYILTDDAGIMRRAKESSQKHRILVFRDFLKERGFELRH